ncbi:MAG: glutathione synthase [Gammaproteobacteria bacterium]|nr:glutathione synthase [Gammaproteobacteria bacterium]
MIRLGVVMDPIAAINPYKDSTLALLLEAQRRGWHIDYMEQQQLYLADNTVHATLRPLRVSDDRQHWFDWEGPEADEPLNALDVILMRKDPPFDIHYIFTTYLLELAERDGVLVVNRPRALRDANEKLSTAWFPHCTAPSVVSSRAQDIKRFLAQHQDIIIKPLTAMGGASVFRLRAGDANLNVVIEVMTDHGQTPVMVQRYLPEIRDGDKRILLIDGVPVPYALARLAAPGETRANLAAGGSSRPQPLTARDRWICDQVGPTLRDMGLLLVGLDVIGDYLTEINVTSPTCIRELDQAYGLNISALLLDCIEERLA